MAFIQRCNVLNYVQCCDVERAKVVSNDFEGVIDVVRRYACAKPKIRECR